MRMTRRLLPLALCSALILTTATAAAYEQADDFVLPARNGSNVRLSDLQGQVVMINFWATWCGPCRQEMPLLEEIQSKYEPLGFTVLGVNVEPDSAAAIDWLGKNASVSFPVLFDTSNEVAEKFGVQGMPSSVFIDRAGQVRHVHAGYKPGDEASYADVIRSLVKE
jgi:thiol-disulfide isomerase/thioredoxin